MALTGFTGAPGVSTFYTNAVPAARSALQAFFTSAGVALAGQVHWEVEQSGDVIDEVSGLTTAAWSDSGSMVGTGGGTGAYVGPAGVVVNWQTAGIVGSRRLRGRTFLVPSSTGTFDSAGTIVDSVVATVASAAATLVTSGGLRIYHRPGPVGSPAGISFPMVSSSVPDLAAVLRSRRT